MSASSPALAAPVQHDGEPGGEGQRDSELPVQPGKTRPSLQVDQGRAHVRGLFLPNAK